MTIKSASTGFLESQCPLIETGSHSWARLGRERSRNNEK